jgi:hypothetical protein
LAFGLTKHGAIISNRCQRDKGSLLPVLGGESRTHFLPAGLWNEHHRRALGADLPLARLDAAATARLLGFAEHHIQVLLRAGKLTPLGDPAPNAPKWFAATELIRLAADRDWLSRASREVSKYWRHKRERCSGPRALGRARAEGKINQAA